MKKITIKNYCVCKKKGAILYLDRDCFAQFHTGKVSKITYDPEALYQEQLERDYKKKLI